MSTGERLPQLVQRSTGVPDLVASTYATTALRPRSGSYETLAGELQGVATLHNFASAKGIDLRQRVADGTFLGLHEQTAYASFVAVAADGSPKAPGTRAIRMTSGLKYVLWRARRHRSSLKDRWEARDRLRVCAAEFLEEFRTVIPRAGGSERQGLNRAQLRGLVALMAYPDRLGALWPTPFVRNRNVTMIWCLLLLGHRVSEFLGLRLTEIDFEGAGYRIQRRPDDPRDPRARNPNVKGFSRDLHLPPEVTRLLRELVRSRSELPYAAAHDFLFTCWQGRPLSRASVTAAFRELRAEQAFLPADLSPHSLRHTWNDEFSRFADERKYTAQEEMKARMFAMGWVSPATAATYTKRHDRRAANEICLAMQDEYMGMTA